MSRMLLSAWMIVFALAIGCSFSRAAFAQERPAAKGAAGAEDPPARPAAAPLRVANVPPELDEVLKAWELASSKIHKLEGKHQRFVYDLVFSVEKRSDGVFYYEAPDKGRIDITPSKFAKGELAKKVDPKTNKPFKLEADRPERWICSGQEILQINDAEKSYEMFPIPPQHQGANIMEGPLPFLFGMPADKAKKRYELTLLRNTDTEARIRAIPRWKADAQQYREATIILDKTEKKYLPYAVQIVDPSGNSETVYRFSELKVNKQRGLLAITEKDPFRPTDIARYKLIANEAGMAQAQGGPGVRPGAVNPGEKKTVERNPLERNPDGATAPATVPSVFGMKWETAEKLLKGAGYAVKFKRGAPATNGSLVYVVYEQTPQKGTPLAKGETVTLTLYDKQASATAEGDPKGGTQKK